MVTEIAFLKLSFLVSSAAMFGSLYFSEVLGYPPCVLCWYQRIAMYPLVFIFGLGIWTEDSKASKYAFPLIGAGLLIAIYHNLLYYHWIPDSITPCQQGVSCTSKQIEWLGFLTIPLMSGLSFSLLLLISLFSKKIRNTSDE